MNRAGTVLFLVGTLTAIIAGIVVFIILLNSQPKPEQVPTTKLVIAFQNIGARSAIIPEQVGLADWPRAVPTPIGGFEKTADVVGKMVSSQVPPGQPIIQGMLIDPKASLETHSNAAFILEKGTVAMALPVTVKSNVAEALQTGDRVDMLVTLHSQTAAGSAAVNPMSNAVTQRLLSDVLILQVGPWPPPGAKQQAAASTTVVTFQLKEQDALVLQHIQEYASSFTLVLRPANDHDLVTLEPVTLDYINQRFGFKLK